MYLIPRNVMTKFQFFPGFGWLELGLTLAGAALGAGLWLVLGPVGAPLGLRLICFVVPPAAAYFVTRPAPDGTSLLVLLRRWRAFGRRQRLYLYVTGRGQ